MHDAVALLSFTGLCMHVELWPFLVFKRSHVSDLFQNTCNIFVTIGFICCACTSSYGRFLCPSVRMFRTYFKTTCNIVDTLGFIFCACTSSYGHFLSSGVLMIRTYFKTTSNICFIFGFICCARVPGYGRFLCSSVLFQKHMQFFSP